MIKATDENIKSLVDEGIKKYGPNADLNYIDTSEVTDMGFLFSWRNFNGDISLWDVSGILYMNDMFLNTNFNRDISKWDVHNVMTTTYMFYDSSFNRDINQWDISKVKCMTNMFYNKIYDQEITWDVDLKELFGDEYDNYLERRKLKLLKDLCIV